MKIILSVIVVVLMIGAPSAFAQSPLAKHPLSDMLSGYDHGVLAGLGWGFAGFYQVLAMKIIFSSIGLTILLLLSTSGMASALSLYVHVSNIPQQGARIHMSSSTAQQINDILQIDR